MNVIFFDLDGTLTDSREGIARCMAYALERLGAAAPPRGQLEKTIGAPLHRSFSELLGAPGEAMAAEAVRLYRERYEAKGIFENRLYPGVVEMLQAVGARAWRACVVTSKPTRYARQIVAHFSLAPYFAAVYGSGMDGGLTEKEELIRHVLAREDAAAASAVMVGDRAHDILGAHANGLRAIGATWGYATCSELEHAGADALCNAPGELFDALARL